ncbi:MAG: carbohydrate porin [Polaromonas sp.]|nr:carbohydrate porin [Polaromonas sp.]
MNLPKPRLSRIAATCLVAASAFTLGPAFGQSDTGSQAQMSTSPTLLGDIGGLRPALARHGVTLGLTETSEWLQNTRGGIKTGHVYHGLSTLTLGLDTEKADAWQGGNFNLSALQIHGQQLSPDYLGSLQTASGIEALSGPRLWELWYEHKAASGLSIKAGQQSLDQEFMVSQFAATFVGTMFGWAAVPSYDLPAGGPAYPLSALGVRARMPLAKSTNLLVGAFVGDPANTSTQDPQKANNRGTTFSLHGGTFYIAELQYSLPEASTADAANAGKPGSYKFGMWYHNKKFADTRFDAGGVSLADPSSSGNPRLHAGNYSVYAVADQTVWGAADNGPRTLNLFARAMAASGDRNLISFSANLGVTLNAPFAGRDSDVAGIGLAYVKVGSHSRALDADNNTFGAGNIPVRKSETMIEATYQYQIRPWWQLQGIFQYTRAPGAGAVDPGDPLKTSRIPNATVLGLRTTIAF